MSFGLDLVHCDGVEADLARGWNRDVELAFRVGAAGDGEYGFGARVTAGGDFHLDVSDGFAVEEELHGELFAGLDA